MNTTVKSSSALARPSENSRRPAFVTTHWSAVVAAGRNDTPRARQALAELCQAYWYPLYFHARRCGHAPHDAQDLTQGFFAQLLERQSLAAANRDLGRFRSFLLTAMNHFLANERQRAQAQKRGSNQELMSLDLAAAEERYEMEPAIDATPDKAFDRRWALAVLDAVLQKLETEHRREGRTELFQALKQSLMGSRETQPYADLAKRLDMTASALKVAVHRLRKRYRELIREEIAHTVASSAEVDGEMRHLLTALAGN